MSIRIICITTFAGRTVKKSGCVNAPLNNVYLPNIAGNGPASITQYAKTNIMVALLFRNKVSKNKIAII